MTEQRLTDLTVLSIERELDSSIPLDDAIDIFSCRQSEKNIRIQLT